MVIIMVVIVRGMIVRLVIVRVMGRMKVMEVEMGEKREIYFLAWNVSCEGI